MLANSSSDSSAKLAQRRTSAGDVGDRRLAACRDVGDDLLGEHVERVAQVAGVLDLAVEHAAHDDRRLEQVAAVLGVDRAPARLADLVAGAADALQAAARPRPGDSTWMTRSTAPMSMPSSRLLVATMARRSPRLSWSSIDDALLAGQRAVVGLDQLLAQAPRLGIDADARAPRRAR